MSRANAEALTRDQVAATAANYHLTADEAARSLGVSHVTYYKLLKIDRVRSRRTNGKYMMDEICGIASHKERAAEIKPIGVWPEGISFR